MAAPATSRGLAADPLWQQAQACLLQGRVDAARAVLASVLLEVGATVAARECLDRPALGDSEDPLVLMRAAALRKRPEQHTEALALLDRAAALGHTSAALRFQRGEALLFKGRAARPKRNWRPAWRRRPRTAVSRCRWYARANRLPNAITCRGWSTAGNAWH